MNVNAVSFGNNFENLVAQPPANSAEAMAAATVMENDSYEGKKMSTGKKVAIGAGIVAAVAATLALLRGKVGAIKNIDLTQKADGFMGKVKYGIAWAGQKVIDGYNAAKGLVTKLFKKADKTGDDAPKPVPNPVPTPAPAPAPAPAPTAGGAAV